MASYKYCSKTDDDEKGKALTCIKWVTSSRFFFVRQFSGNIYFIYDYSKKNRCFMIDQNFQSKSWKLASSKHEPGVKEISFIQLLFPLSTIIFTHDD